MGAMINSFRIFILIVGSTVLAFRPKPTQFIHRELACIKHFKATTTKLWLIFGMTMMSWVSPASQQLKIIYTVITSIMVFVMDNLRRCEFPPQMLLHNKTVDSVINALNYYPMITKIANVAIFIPHIHILPEIMANVNSRREVCYRR